MSAGEGGLNIPDLTEIIHSLNIAWFKRIMSGNPTWKKVLYSTQLQFPNLFVLGYDYLLYLKTRTQNCFWSEILESTYHYAKTEETKTWAQFLSTSFLYNSNIKINKKIINNNIFIKNNICLIHQLRGNSGYLSQTEFEQKYAIRRNFLTYNATLLAIKKWDRKLHLKQDVEDLTQIQPVYKYINDSQKVSSCVYKKTCQ